MTHELRELKVILEQGEVTPLYEHECWCCGAHLPKRQKCYSVRYADRLYSTVKRIWVCENCSSMFQLGTEDLQPHEQDILQKERFIDEVFYNGVG